MQLTPEEMKQAVRTWRAPDASQGPSAHPPSETADGRGALAVRTGSLPAPRKGEKHGECNRTACHNKNALWWNSSTRRFYCQPCAHAIMSYPENAGLLTLTEPEENNTIGHDKK